MLKMEDYNQGLIYTEINGCLDCNKCIRECPILKSNVSVMDMDGQYKVCVDDKECILCGTCMVTCVHDVRHYRDDTDDFFADLKKGKEFSVIIAPAFYLNYPNEYKKILGYLQSLGVKKFYPVSYGADIAVWGYLNYLKTSPITNGHISQPCPSIVSHIEKHLPELMPNLIPIQSPMMCTAIYLKKYKNVSEDLVFLSPCIAKKIEMSSERGRGLVKYNVTFSRLIESLRNVNIENFPDVGEEFESGMGSLFPYPGGLRENIEYYLGREIMIMQVEGERKAHEYLQSFATDFRDRKHVPTLIDILNCEHGCGEGTGTDFYNVNEIAYQALIMRSKKYADFNPQSTPAQRLAILNEKFSALDIEDFKCEYKKDKSTKVRVIPLAKIEEVLTEKLMKLSDNDKHIDCSACGYMTCNRMAEAIALGINHEDNCVYYVKNILAKSMREKMAAEAELRAFINAMPMVANIRDKDLNIVDCNEEALRVFGMRSLREYREKSHLLWPEYQPDKSRSREKAIQLQKEAKDVGYLRFDWLHQNINGEPIPTETTLVRFTWHGEDHVLAFIKDMREFNKKQHKLKARLEAEQQRLQAMLDSSPLVCALFDHRGYILSVSQKAEVLFEIPDKQIFLDNISKFFPEYQPDGSLSYEANMKYLLEAIETGYQRYEWVYQTLDGKPIPCEETLERVLFGDKVYVLLYIRDLREQNDMLTQLEESSNRALIANQAKTRFLARMSHEIRTPMNSIMGITELQLQKDTHAPDVEEAFTRIYDSSSLLLSIINDILDLSKVEAGKMEIIPEIYETASMIVDTVQLNLMYIGSKRIDFKLDVDENLPAYLVGDELRVKQILNNILSNAFKYTSDGEVCLSFKVEEGERAEDVVIVVQVRDTGQGMTQEQVDSLFSGDFTRFNLADNRGIEGSGLGLNIAYQLALMMDGGIFVESEQGRGSTFTIYLPQEKINDTVIGEEAAVGLQNLEDTQKSLKRLSKLEREPMPYGRVLVVDDVESNLFVAKGFLMPYKIAIDTAESGILAIEKVKAGEVYDIIFMDHMMPDMDGVETTKVLRKMGYYHPIVALTANAFSDMATMFLENGFSGYASKPIDFKQLDKYLMQFIRDKQPPEVIAQARKAKAALYAGRDKNEGLSVILINSFIRDAKKAMFIVESLNIYDVPDDEELQAFIVQTHAMKSALTNVGKKELANVAKALEQAARDQNISLINDKTPYFLTELAKIIKELEIKSNESSVDNEQDMIFLREQMGLIWEACEFFDIDGANDALKLLGEKSFSAETRSLISEVEDLILSGDFGEAGEIARKASV
ncbi:MAG: ATP-binding protein [Defluviitaleaceae bacterium]|nr:ATP-binding protein [Defluviitaleaceae bacterium]